MKLSKAEQESILKLIEVTIESVIGNVGTWSDAGLLDHDDSAAVHEALTRRKDRAMAMILERLG